MDKTKRKKFISFFRLLIGLTFFFWLLCLGEYPIIECVFIAIIIASIFIPIVLVLDKFGINLP